MLRAMLRHIFRQATSRNGRGADRCSRERAVRNAQFASFVNANGCLPPRRLDAHDAALRRRRWLRRAAFAGLTVLGTWVAIESAQALAMF